MIILGIETSCDETALSIVNCSGGLASPAFAVLGSALYSQADLHAPYGGVFPNLAKREHEKNLPILLEQILRDFDHSRIEAIAVTAGPGLEPALWAGIEFAKALAQKWNLPLIPTNHMIGHMVSVLVNTEAMPWDPSLKALPRYSLQFPALALLISGGHTEIVLATSWAEFEIIGQTRDDAVGEAFDKVARMLDLPYPGGPQISLLAEQAYTHNIPRNIKLPRPMIHSKDLDFSFSGLKTAVLYTIRDLTEAGAILTEEIKMDIAREFQEAVIEVLTTKISRALDETGAETLIVSGGVIANTRIREAFEQLVDKKYPYVKLCVPEKLLATDNAIMIACAGYLQSLSKPELVSGENDFRAQGNLRY